MKTIIRPATSDDLDLLMDMAEGMHAESPRYSRMHFSADKVLALFVHLIANPDGLLIVAEYGDQIIGGMAGFIAPHWFSVDRIASEYGVFVLPPHRGGMTAARLIRAYISWAKDMGVGLIQLGISTGIQTDDTVKFYKALGLKQVSYGFEV